MTYILYGSRRSGSLTVELALSEIGATYETRNVDLNVDAQLGDDYRAVNPQGKIPALITPEGETLTESVAILLTLDERHPEAKLLPPVASPERAQALRTLLFVATEIYPMVEINDYPERFAPSSDGVESMREIARDYWCKRWLLVEESILGDPYFLPSGFSLADIYIAVVSRWAQQEKWRAANLPKVERLTAAVASRASCAEVWRQHLPAEL